MPIYCFVFESAIWAEFSGMGHLCSAWHQVDCLTEADASISKWFTCLPGKLVLAVS